MKKQLLLLAMILLPLVASAETVEINGIYYNLVSKIQEAEVTSNPNNYTGSVVIPEKVTYESVEYSVTSIGNGAFRQCSGLTSITIPNSVTSIGYVAFDGVDIPTVISLIENPFKIEGKTSDSRTFSQNTFNNATLYVPKGTIDKYKATDGWKDFLFIEEGTGGGDTPTTQKCEKPTISYENGKLTFTSETEGVKFIYDIQANGSSSGEGNVLDLTPSFTVKVYASKEGYEDSDVATETINIIKGDTDGDGVVDIADAVRIVNFIVGKIPALAPRSELNLTEPE